MTATEVIERIKALSPDEIAKVVDFVREMDQQAKSKTFEAGQATPTGACNAAIERIFNQYDDLFKKLSQ
jgi:predicted PP-loop superfamily ATPase